MIFILSALWQISIRGLWKLPDGRDRLWGKLGLILMSEAMLSKSLIQFSVDGQGCLPSLFDLRPNYGGHVMTIMGTSFKRPPASTAALSAPEPAAGRCWPTPLLETPGHSRASLSWGHCSSLLGAGVHKVLSVPSKSPPANLENSAMTRGLQRVSFHSNPKERQCQRMLKLLHNCTHLTR